MISETARLAMASLNFLWLGDLLYGFVAEHGSSTAIPD
jgi:hypothetical protein